MKRILILLSTVFTLVSCSDKLSRSEAEKLIRAKHIFPFPATATLRKTFTKDEHGSVFPNPLGYGEPELIAVLQQQKLIELKEEYKSQPGYLEPSTWTVVTIVPTKEAQQYVIREDEASYTIKLFDNDFWRIIGIVEYEQPMRFSEVQYTSRPINFTPFNYCFTTAPADVYKATFVKYDDGWRLQQN